MVHLWSAKVVIIQVYDCTGDQCPHWDAKCSGHLSVIQRQRRGLQFSRVWSQVKQQQHMRNEGGAQPQGSLEFML